MRILAVANPTLDLAAAEREITSLKELGARQWSRFRVQVTVLAREEATRRAFSELLSNGEYDMLHFAGHGSFDRSAPEMSGIRFADGVLSAEDILNLKWKAPPYFVFSSACESGRSAGGMRLVSEENHSNGLAGAFLGSGVYGYAGYYWPVTDIGAGMFAKVFYKTMFERENIGIAFLEARRSVARELGATGDITGSSAVLIGDAASKHRRDLAMQV